MKNTNRTNAVRKKLQVTQAELAQAIGVTTNYVALLEQNRRNESAAIRKLLNALAAGKLTLDECRRF